MLSKILLETAVKLYYARMWANAFKSYRYIYQRGCYTVLFLKEKNSFIKNILVSILHKTLYISINHEMELRMNFPLIIAEPVRTQPLRLATGAWLKELVNTSRILL